MKKNLNKSIFSVLLAVAMLLSSLVISSYATEEPEKTSYSLPITTNTNTDQVIDHTQNTDQVIDHTQNTDQGLDADELVPIYENDIVITEPGSAGEGVYEILSMRDENTKYISLGGGRYQAVSYMEAVHRKASDGSFVDIDNRISLVGDKYITPDSRVSFDKNNAGFTIDEEGYKISLELSVSDIDNKIDANENASLVEITNHEERTEDLSSLTALEKLERIRNVDNKSTLKYVSVNANTDVEYILASNDVKENIIVKNRADGYEYSFLLTLDGLYAEENEDGSISLCDSESDENKYVIPAPYMYDANDVYSYDVDYELIPVPDKDGIYILIVTADEEFINSDDRAFPIVIDPTVIVKTPKIDVQDTYIDSNNPGYPHGYGSRLYVGSKITYIKTDLPNLPEGATLASAKLYVPYYFDSAYKYGRADICANQMMNNWNEYTLTWNAASAMTNSPNGIYMGYKQSYSCLVSLNYSSIYPVYATFDITSFANMWYSGEAQNYGIALTRVSGDIDEAIIYSRESSGSHRSYMIYEYVSEYIPNGVYAIKNVGDPTCYAMADATTPVNAAVLKKGTYTTSPAIEFARSALFKIIRVEGTDRYVIRSMLNNEYILAFTENEVVTKKANPNDMQVSEYDTFYIQYDSSRDGFIIKPYMSSYAMSMGYTSDNFVKAPATSIGTAVVWDLEVYTGSHQKGGNIYASPMYAGETGELYPYAWSTVIGRNEVTVDVGYTDIVSPYWNQTDKILYLTVHDEGSVPISVNIKGYTTNEYQPIFEADYHVYLPFEEGTYFFRNRQLQNYMQIDDDKAPNYNASKASLELFSFDGEDYQKWNVEHVRDGYYKIVSAKSGLVISVQENYLNTAEKEVFQETYTGADRQQWNFEVTGRGTYIVRAKSNVGNTTDLSLCSKISGSTNGRKVVQGTYEVNDVYYDEWEIKNINIELNTPVIAQSEDSWCWVTAAQMMVRTLYNEDGSSEELIAEQRRAVYYVFGDESSTSELYDWENDPQGLKGKEGIFTSVAKAAAFMAGNVGLDVTFCGYPTPYSESVLIEFLLDGYSIACLRAWVDFSIESTNQDDILSDSERRELLLSMDPTTTATGVGGHVIVIKGVNWCEENECYVFTINDPSDARTYTLTYQQLSFDYDYNTHKLNIWFPTVVVKTDYCEKTFLEEVIEQEYSSTD